MTIRLSNFHRRLGSIFRKRGSRVAPKKTTTNTKKKAEECSLVDDALEEDDTEDTDETTVKLEESESSQSLTLGCVSCGAFDYVLPSKEVEATPAVETAATTKDRRRATVTFSQVAVRSYELILGDNPYCKYPLSLGWKYSEEEQASDVNAFEELRAKKQAQVFQDRIQPRLYVAPENAAALPQQNYLSDVHMEEDYDDGCNGAISELSLYERRMRLRSFGYTEAALREAERQRIVNLALEWRKDGGAVDTPPFPYHIKFITRYTM